MKESINLSEYLHGDDPNNDNRFSTIAIRNHTPQYGCQSPTKHH